ncbi:MAG: META domain-containing protein [Bacteroidota bacterium]
MIRIPKSFFAVVLVGLLAVSCDSSDDATSNPVLGTWRIVSIKVSDQTLTQRSPSDERITITFNEDNNFSGSTSVNQFNGRYELENTTLTLLEFTTTEVLDTTFGTVFYEAIAEAIVPDRTFAQFGSSFDSENLILVFGNSGEMILEQE